MKKSSSLRLMSERKIETEIVIQTIIHISIQRDAQIC